MRMAIRGPVSAAVGEGANGPCVSPGSLPPLRSAQRPTVAGGTRPGPELQLAVRDRVPQLVAARPIARPWPRRLLAAGLRVSRLEAAGCRVRPGPRDRRQ